MGMFDSIYFTCPSCGEEIEDQSKGGDCVLAKYRADAVPIDVAGGIIGGELWCQNQQCTARVYIVEAEPKNKTVSLCLKLKEE